MKMRLVNIAVWFDPVAYVFHLEFTFIIDGRKYEAHIPIKKDIGLDELARNLSRAASWFRELFPLPAYGSERNDFTVSRTDESEAPNP